MLFITSTIFTVLIAATSVAGQSVITNVAGAPGKTGVGFGVTDPTGKKTPIAKQFSQYRTAKESGCGFANGDLANVVNTRADLTKAINAGLPAPDSTGKITLTMNVVSATGGGPYICKVRPNSLITGKGTFQPTVKTITDVGNSTTGAQKLVLQMPSDLKCTGPSASCLLRCKNALKEPFGGCFAITDGSGSAKRHSVTRLLHEARLDDELLEARDDVEDSD